MYVRPFVCLLSFFGLALPHCPCSCLTLLFCTFRYQYMFLFLFTISVLSLSNSIPLFVFPFPGGLCVCLRSRLTHMTDAFFLFALATSVDDGIRYNVGRILHRICLFFSIAVRKHQFRSTLYGENWLVSWAMVLLSSVSSPARGVDAHSPGVCRPDHGSVYTTRPGSRGDQLRFALCMDTVCDSHRI